VSISKAVVSTLLAFLVAKVNLSVEELA